MAALAFDWLRHFHLLLWNRQMEFKETWQEARSQRPLPSLCYSWRLEKKMAALASDCLDLFWLLLCNSWTEFNETWQEARSQDPLPCLYFSAQSVNKNGRPGRFLKKVAHRTQVHDMWPFGPLVYIPSPKIQGYQISWFMYCIDALQGHFIWRAKLNYCEFYNQYTAFMCIINATQGSGIWNENLIYFEISMKWTINYLQRIFWVSKAAAYDECTYLKICLNINAVGTSSVCCVCIKFVNSHVDGEVNHPVMTGM